MKKRSSRSSVLVMVVGLIAAFGIISFLFYHHIHTKLTHGTENTVQTKSQPHTKLQVNVPLTSVNQKIINKLSGRTAAADVGTVTSVHDQWFDHIITNAHKNWATMSMINSTTTTEMLKTSIPIQQLSQLFQPIPSPTMSPSSSKIHAVTYASHGGRDDRFCRAVESAIRNDVDLIILGWGLKWLGLSQKLEAAHSYAKSLPANDVILFTDAFDVLFADSGTSIHRKFLNLTTELDSTIIFSAECGCWPHIIEDIPLLNTGRKQETTCFGKYPRSPTPYRYLNSGTWIGYANASAEMLAQVMMEAGKDFGNANDQKLVADMYMDGRHGIKLDFYNVLFQSMHMTSSPLAECNPQNDVRLTPNGTWINQRTHAQPTVFHFNGGGKAHHLDMESKVWYKQPQHNTPAKKQALASHLLHVPTANKKQLRFDQICGDYLSNMH